MTFMTSHPGSSALLFAALLATAPASLAAQTPQRPPAFVAVHGDTVVLHLTESPSLYGGFVVYRGEPGGELERVTAEPVRPVRRPAAARAVIGDDFDAAMRAAQATDAGELLRRLRGRPFAADILSGLYPGVARLLGRRWSDPGRTPGERLEYRIVFTDNRNEETERSHTVAVRVEERLPEPASGLAAEAGDGEVHLSWGYAAFTGQPTDIAVGFHISRAADDEPFRTLTASPVLREMGRDHAYVDREAENGVRYRYRVRAVDLIGRESEASPVVAASPVDGTAPLPPRGLAARAGDGEALVAWRVSPEADVNGYHIERATGRSAAYERLNQALIPALEPAWRDTSVVGRTQYFYRILAVDEQGNISEPSSAFAVVPEDRTPPAPPSALAAEVDGRTIRLQWEAPPGDDVIGYYVSRAGESGRFIRITGEPVVPTEFVDSGFAGRPLDSGGRYTLAVAAVDGAYNVSDSTVIEVTVPDLEPPTPPTGFHVRDIGGRYARISWSASPSPDVERYILARGAVDPAGELTELGDFMADGAMAARDSAVVHGGRYRFTLIAMDAAGNRSEPAVDTLVFRRPTPPPAPRHAAVAAAPDGIEVTWERVADDQLVGYHVYRSTLPNGVYTRLTETPVAERRYLDPAGEHSHYYIVRAVDRSGNESDRSPAVRIRETP